ncbi:hypothetical protein [Sulfurovum sp.]|uniref:hypothetical protein n=1 Tax=Sulfurovum sp. TaxID=1969726 RepID=UPI0035697D9D
MRKLTKSQRKAVNEKASHQQHSEQETQHLTQNNIYHLGASEIDALHRMQNDHPEIVDKILGFKQQELDLQNDIITIEKNEQDKRIKEVPYVRTYAFIGQFMAFSIAILSLSGAAYFGMHKQPILAGLFLTSTVLVAAVQYINKSDNKK